MITLVKNPMFCLMIGLFALAGLFLLSETALAVTVEADAGDDLEITEGLLIKLKGSGEGEEIDYFWSCNGGTLSNAYIAQPNFTAPMVSQDTEFICNLIVSDEDGQSATDSTIVLAKDNGDIASFRVDARVKNTSQGQTDWYVSVGAKPGDNLSFQIMITANGDKAPEDVEVKNTLPEGLIYTGGLKIADVSQPSEEDITEGIEIKSIKVDQTKRITFSAEVAEEEEFDLDKTILISIALAFSEEYSGADTAKVVISEEGTIGNVKNGNGAGDVSTGIGTTILTSVLFPLALAGLLVWLFKSQIIGFDLLVNRRKKNIINYRNKKRLRKLSSRLTIEP